jgi:Ca2+-binding RTX toxin-like protein
MLGRALIGFATVAGMLLASAPAFASQAFISSPGRVHYVAAPGEANSPTFVEEAMGLRVSDAGTTVVAGVGCVQDGADAVCDAIGWERFVIALGDGNDHLDVSHALFTSIVSGGAGDDQIVGSLNENRLDGGPGNDVLRGGELPDTIIGGEGNDQIVGGPDGDILVGGPGDDDVRGGLGWDTLSGGPGDDVLNGNSGFDDIQATGNVNFLLKPGLLIGLGRDRTSQIEAASLTGGAGANMINARAWRGPVMLFGLRGDDVLIGGRGSDYIEGGRGRDRVVGGLDYDILNGGGGDDTFFSRDGGFDNVYGESGTDSARIDLIDVALEVERYLR